MPAGIKANPDGSAAIQVGGTDVITLTSGGAATFVTSPTTVQAGTAAAPSITFSGDTDTGIFSPGANTLAFSTNGTEDARFDSAGNMGLGVTPSAWQSGTKAFQMDACAIWARGASVGTELVTNGYFNGAAYLYTNNGAAARYLQSGTTHTWYGAPSGTAGNAITFTPVMTVGTGVSLALENASSQTGTGITFPATQSASSNANTLDDYEEGTYTPQIVVEGGNPLNASTVYEGSYTKIGNTVRVTVHAVWNNVTAAGGTSAIQLHNFPFPFALTSNAEGTQAYGTHFSTGIAGLNQVLNLRPVQNNVTWCYLYGFWGTTLPQTYGYLRVNSNPITNGTATTLQFVIVYRTTQ